MPFTCNLNHTPLITTHTPDTPITALTLWKNASISGHVPWEISSAWVVEVTYIVSGDGTAL